MTAVPANAAESSPSSDSSATTRRRFTLLTFSVVEDDVAVLMPNVAFVVTAYNIDYKFSQYISEAFSCF